MTKYFVMIFLCSQLFAEAAAATREEILEIAQNSQCMKYKWRDRGKAPAGFVKGMALTYARSLCRLRQDSSIAGVMSQKNTHVPKVDALAYLTEEFHDNKIYDFESDGLGPLKTVYTLGMGLAMRESGGRYCEGADPSENAPPDAASAGLFQFSYNLMQASPLLKKLYDEYRSSRFRCFRSVYDEGVSCAPHTIVGNGAAEDFQRFTKSCPAFATEFALLSVRIVRKHYGPINRKEVELRKTCETMFERVEDIILSDREESACSELW
jgi:hypothetical protein